ncbi:hypothetical protein [uncultured Abyssibacter sp.]|uniref:hypothetical protein n=1 Tax=uncultured Abyssibacter sp. TaxID=2320202 RepID=UPI0032B1000B
MSDQDGRGIYEIDFADFGGPIYIGRKKGEQSRKASGIEGAVRDGLTIELRVPQDVLAINSSFILGFLGPELRAATNITEFLDKFNFLATGDQWSDFLRDEIVQAMTHAKFKNSPLL